MVGTGIRLQDHQRRAWRSRDIEQKEMEQANSAWLSDWMECFGQLGATNLATQQAGVREFFELMERGQGTGKMQLVSQTLEYFSLADSSASAKTFT